MRNGMIKNKTRVLIFLISFFNFLSFTTDIDYSYWAQSKKKISSKESLSKSKDESSLKKTKKKDSSNENKKDTDETKIKDSSIEAESQTLLEEPSTSFYDTLKQGGILIIPLILLLLASLTIIIERIIFYSRNKAWNTKEFENILRRKGASSYGLYREILEEELKEEGQNYMHKLEKGLGLLSGIGNIAPLVGFLGTVLGMISSFSAIAATSTVNAQIVASGIQEALVTTAGGLCVAVPTLIAYYIFMHLIQNMNASIDSQVQEICSKQKSIAEEKS